MHHRGHRPAIVEDSGNSCSSSSGSSGQPSRLEAWLRASSLAAGRNQTCTGGRNPCRSLCLGRMLNALHAPTCAVAGRARQVAGTCAAPRPCSRATPFAAAFSCQPLDRRARHLSLQPVHAVAGKPFTAYSVHLLLRSLCVCHGVLYLWVIRRRMRRSGACDCGGSRSRAGGAASGPNGEVCGNWCGPALGGALFTSAMAAACDCAAAPC